MMKKEEYISIWKNGFILAFKILLLYIAIGITFQLAFLGISILTVKLSIPSIVLDVLCVLLGLIFIPLLLGSIGEHLKLIRD